jgi:acetyltransferase-like isoleucine patch superfamily enzyme
LTLGRGTVIGEDCRIHALSRDGVRLGDGVSVGRHSVIECTGSLRHLGKGLNVGHRVGFSTHCYLGCAGGVEIGDDTIFGNFVSLHSENHISEDLTTPVRLQGVTHLGIRIGADCWIGAKVTILDGVTVEDRCIIAAGALLTRGVYASEGIYAGVPAKRIGTRGGDRSPCAS